MWIPYIFSAAYLLHRTPPSGPPPPVLWLEDYLVKWPKTLLVVSHAREFLNVVATDILHLHSQKIITYKVEGRGMAGAGGRGGEGSKAEGAGGVSRGGRPAGVPADRSGFRVLLPK